MVKIDLATASNTMYVTLRELSVKPQPTYKLELFNFSTNETFIWSSITATSDDRKDVISLVTSAEFLGRTPSVGQYRYSFYEYLGPTYGVTYSLVEKGIAKVVDSRTTDGYVSIAQAEADDDYVSL